DENPSATVWPNLVGFDEEITFSSNITDVAFDRDRTVDSLQSVVIPSGMKIGFAPEDAGDPGNGGVSPKCELVVKDGGELVAVGEPTSLVQLRSTVPDSLFQTGNEWFGVRLGAMVEATNGYGFASCVETPTCTPTYYCSQCDDERSEFKHVRISGASRGLSIEGDLAPDLSDVEFANPPGSLDIYLNRDVVVPVDFEWHLVAPTDVVVSDTNSVADYDTTYGTPGKIDLLVEGRLATETDNPGVDYVRFRPEDPNKNPVTADDWGGVQLSWARSGDRIDGAEFSHAENLLYVVWPGVDGDTTRITNSVFHDFGDIGLWVYGSYGPGVEVGGNTFYRGDDLPRNLGRVGAFLDGTDRMWFHDNTVSLETNLQGDPWAGSSRAVEAYFGKNLCLYTPSDTLEFLIEDNEVIGPGETVVPQAPPGLTGIYANWLCGGSNRTAEIRHNWVRGFNYTGLEFSQCEDVQVDCNLVEDNARAVEHRRDWEPQGPGVRFHTNKFETNADRDGLVRSDNAKKAKLGGSLTINKGDNELWTSDQGGALTRFLLEDEPGASHDSLDAQNNLWFKNSSRLFAVDSISLRALIWTTLTDTTSPDPDLIPLVDVDPPNVAINLGPGCWEWGAARMGAGTPGGASGTIGDRVHGDDAARALASSMVSPFPNPSRHATRIDLKVAEGAGGRYRVEIFDVQGRHVATVLERLLTPGDYSLAWDGRRSDGFTVGAGVYF
ncbi:hypothetical protein K8I85_10190, partial [bacterium]|nr:hypothetical protein [bacterium]